MAITVRAFLKSAAGLIAALLGHASASTVLAPQLTISAFIARLRQDPALRQRFAESPAAVLREHGIDPAPYRFPERMSEAQLDRLLAQFAQAQSSPQPPPAAGAGPNPPAVVYGPPARPPQQQSGPSPKPLPPRQPQPPPVAPPAPVYGPPPGLPR
jgi:hypothetical protein